MLTTIEGLTITSANYEETMKLLKGRFGDKKLLVATIDALI